MIGLRRDEAGEGSAGRANRTLFRSLQNFYSLGFLDLSHQAKLIFLPVEIGPIPADINRLYFTDDDGGAMLRQKSRIGCGKAFVFSIVTAPAMPAPLAIIAKSAP